MPAQTGHQNQIAAMSGALHAARAPRRHHLLRPPVRPSTRAKPARSPSVHLRARQTKRSPHAPGIPKPAVNLRVDVDFLAKGLQEAESLSVGKEVVFLSARRVGDIQVPYKSARDLGDRLCVGVIGRVAQSLVGILRGGAGRFPPAKGFAVGSSVVWGVEAPCEGVGRVA